jgi:peptidoglycan-N-acetylglucosamine deacetylase
VGLALATLAGLAAILGVVVWHPRPIVRWLARRSPDVLYYVETETRVVALTIDDGPSTDTALILDALAASDTRATFFVIGRHVAELPHVAQRMARDGHELANHSYEHGMSAVLSPRRFEESILSTDRLIAPLGASRWFRPGSGWYTREMLDVASRHGLRCVLGSVYPVDPQMPSRRHMRAFLRRHVHPGAIIVLHDGPGRGARTADVLRRLLPELAARGFRVGTVSDLADSA